MATYYVDGTRADDTGAGTSEGTAKKTIQAGINLLAAGDTLYIKASTTYTLTSTVSITPNGDSTSGPIIVEGYTTTAGTRDGRPTITSSTASLALFTFTSGGGDFTQWRHINCTHSGSPRGIAFTSDGGGTTVSTVWQDCIFNGCLRAINSASSIQGFVVDRCEIMNCTDTSATVVFHLGGCIFSSCDIHDNVGPGLQNTNGWGSGVVTIVKNCLITGNSKGIDELDNFGSNWLIENNTIANNTGDGISFVAKSSGTLYLWLTGNLVYGNGGYGVDSPDTAAKISLALLLNRNNAYGNNTSGARLGVPAGYNDISLTAGPFTNSGGRDFSLNTTVGGGALLRATNYPGVFLSGTTVGYLDVGAVQSQSISVPSVMIQRRRKVI